MSYSSQDLEPLSSVRLDDDEDEVVVELYQPKDAIGSPIVSIVVEDRPQSPSNGSLWRWLTSFFSCWKSRQVQKSNEFEIIQSTESSGFAKSLKR